MIFKCVDKVLIICLFFSTVSIKVTNFVRSSYWKNSTINGMHVRLICMSTFPGLGLHALLSVALPYLAFMSASHLNSDLHTYTPTILNWATSSSPKISFFCWALDPLAITCSEIHSLTFCLLYILHLGPWNNTLLGSTFLFVYYIVISLLSSQLALSL